MKKLAITTVVALGVAIPSLAAAMDSQKLHSDEARAIFEQLAEEARDND